MKDILVILPSGNVLDKSNGHYVHFNGTAPAFFGATLSSGPINLAVNGGQILVHNGSSMNWVTPQSSMGAVYPSVPQQTEGPKYISAVGGVFYKDQVDNKSKYSSTIIGKFSSQQTIRE